ncbi:MAG: ATP-binding cassette domain-containing protein [Pseudolabrys sp.]|nr:ATP-binding cassette domain-containing protein [Pseudolabrys sp.]
MIIFTDATVAAGKVTILDQVSVAFAAGPPTVLIGPNGAGKTTMLRAAMGLVKLNSGAISCLSSARRAIVFQRPVMLRRSAAANIDYALARGEARTQRIEELLNLVGLAGFGDRPARRLSGGEQQRLALARALARDPAILFLDEPSASLDPASTKAIEDIIRAVSARGVKVVLSTHDLGQAKRLAGDVVLLHRGRVIEHAPASEFFAEPKTDQALRFMAGELLV